MTREIPTDARGRVKQSILLAGGEKFCTSCKAVKGLSEFTGNSARYDGLSVQCTKCLKGYQNGYNQRQERKKKNAKDALTRWHAKTDEEKALAGKASKASMPHLSRYGMTKDQYDEMLEAQGGGCAMCGKTPSENGRRLCVDHDHLCCDTGKNGKTCGKCNRGLLCLTCNVFLGYLENDEWISKANGYLTTWRTK